MVRQELAAAQRDAAAAGRRLTLTSGRRSRQRQQDLFDQAVRQLGSVSAARPWVLPPQESKHVLGLAVDVGDQPAARWLEAHGGTYGFCRTYPWEWWHFEYRDAWRGRPRPPSGSVYQEPAPTGPAPLLR